VDVICLFAIALVSILGHAFHGKAIGVPLLVLMSFNVLPGDFTWQLGGEVFASWEEVRMGRKWVDGFIQSKSV